MDSSRTQDNVVFIAKPIADAYDDIFGAAIERYNAKQKRSDRKINCGYFEHLFKRAPAQSVVTSSDKRKSFYEDVVQIGTKDDTGVGSPDAAVAAECLTEYMNGFQTRNPNFFVFNAVLHLDEATPHLHIDYIPVGHYKQGIDTQNGIAQALKEMGYGVGKDAISRWRERERKVLEDICKSHGIDIVAPQKSRGTFEVEEYKRYKANIDALEKEKQTALDRAEKAEKAAQAAEQQLKELNGKVLTAQKLKEINGKKSIGGALKNVTWEEWQSVKETAVSALSEKAALKYDNDKLKKEIDDLKKENNGLSEQVRALNYELTSSFSDTSKRAFTSRCIFPNTA